MKNQVSPPALTTAAPVPFANATVSYVQCTEVGAQALPVRSEAAAPDIRKTLFLLRATSWTASATLEVGTSTIASTPSLPNHWLAIADPTSGLFWWSALISSIVLPLPLPPTAAIGVRAAS